MPELPEVELCRRQLALWSADRPLAAVRLVDPAVVRNRWSTRPSDADPEGAARLPALAGRTPDRPQRHGKRLAWMFGDRGLLIHLGMTGQWLRLDAEAPDPGAARLGLQFGSEVLWFVDRRRFGCVVEVPRVPGLAALSHELGPDAWLQTLDGPALAAALRGRRAVKVALMDQRRIAGLGNIHAAEACFRAGVAPGRPASALTAAEWEGLAGAIRSQLEAALASMPVDEALVYVTAGGDNPFSVYKRAGEACPRCGGTVVSEPMGGRSTFWCPGCQR